MGDRKQLARGRSARWVLPLVALLIAFVAARDCFDHEDLERATESEPESLPATDPGPAARNPPRRTTQPAQKGSSAPCAPAAGVRCFQGDVWSVDGCSELETKLDECGARPCREGACDEEPDAPCTEPVEGRCDGDRVELCYAGVPRTIDCGLQGLRCVYGDEGAQCAPQVPPQERCAGAARCEGDVLVQCEQGQRMRVDCALQRAHCLVLEGASAPSCVRTLEGEPSAALPCGPCGCPADRSRLEARCDGRDEDGDGLIDEELDCGRVPVIAFVITDAAGQSSHGADDIREELLRANAAFESPQVNGALAFMLDELVWIADDTLLEIDEKELQVIASDPRFHPQRERFYVPLVFTDGVSMGGGTPKTGISTLPNGTCGGLQDAAGPEVGVVIVAKGRSPTTVAHELGHFLGLCHTHDQRSGPALTAAADPRTQQLAACERLCRDEGDGVCDTPFDPGPEHCLYDAMCDTRCREGDEPDPTNLMGYYTECRQRFSDDQVRLMQHTLALRRGWHACFAGDCPCELGGAQCPAGMSCRPALRDGRALNHCTLDGPRAPGSDCSGTYDCGQGSVCFAERATGRARCVRPCLGPRSDCQCVSTDADVSVCSEDFTAQ